ncbi:isocitrate lyase/phosphoenolpyruvate mutase family protein [Streptomyces sp. NPDC051217]|uniref:isocitrate lyase/phosphoenolpyruvate mutase family protein n=1 Tax=Streptomyces sp. NPDC051217 TaxID=3365644 RepID=UPI00379EDBD4
MTSATSPTGPGFHELHYQDRPLVLPNAWDVPSALAFLDAGFAAVGTTSFGVASGLGRQDASVAATLDRAARYVDAGADGVFVPGATDPALLRELAAAVPVPPTSSRSRGFRPPVWRSWAYDA